MNPTTQRVCRARSDSSIRTRHAGHPGRYPRARGGPVRRSPCRCRRHSRNHATETARDQTLHNVVPSVPRTASSSGPCQRGSTPNEPPTRGSVFVRTFTSVRRRATSIARTAPAPKTLLHPDRLLDANATRASSRSCMNLPAAIGDEFGKTVLAFLAMNRTIP